MSKASIDRHDKAERERKLSALHERLADEVEALRTGEDWQRWLTTTARFHTYSFQNTLLIHAQRPDATRVAGYQVWRTLGRQVTKGEKGIAILAPVIRRTPTEDVAERKGYDANQSEAQRKLAGFRLTHVWDVDQTSGTPLPEPPAPTLLEGQAPTGLWDSLAAEVTRAGFELERGACGTANGTTNFTTRVVRVRDDVDDAQAVKTLAHELGHVLLHQPTEAGAGLTCRGVVEVEAESVAYLVLTARGLKTDEYTFPYVAHWADVTGARAADVVRATGQRVLGAVRTLLDRTHAPATEAFPSAATTMSLAELSAHGGRSSTRVAEFTSRPDESGGAGFAPRHDNSKTGQGTSGQSPTDRRVLIAIHHAALDFFRSNVRSSWVPDYLASRSLEAALSERWRAGYAPERWTALVGHLRELGFADEDLLASGIASRARTGQLIDRFRDRLVLPIQDEHGDVVAFVGRTGPQASAVGAPRYLNSPQTELYRKREVLFGLAESADPLARGAVPTLVEGPLDAIAVTEGTDGRCVGVAACGTAVTADHLAELARNSRAARLVVAFDSDAAGQKVAERLLPLLAGRGLEAWAASLPAEQDPAAVLHRQGPAALTSALLDQARPLADAVVQARLSDWGDRLGWVEGQIGALRSVAPLVAVLPGDDRIRLSLQIAKRTTLDLATVQREIGACLPLKGLGEPREGAAFAPQVDGLRVGAVSRTAVTRRHR